MRKQVMTGVMVALLGVMLAVVPASAGDDGGYFVVKGGYFSPTSGGF